MGKNTKNGGSASEVESPNLETESTEVEVSKFSQSTEPTEVEVIKDFKGLKVGDVVTVSKNVAEILTSKGLVK
jgi:hypothetical protein